MLDASPSVTRTKKQYSLKRCGRYVPTTGRLSEDYPGRDRADTGASPEWCCSVVHISKNRTGIGMRIIWNILICSRVADIVILDPRYQVPFLRDPTDACDGALQSFCATRGWRCVPRPRSLYGLRPATQSNERVTVNAESVSCGYHRNGIVFDALFPN